MYLTMCANITFPARDGRGAFNIRRINYCRVDRSWETLTNTAEIRLPRNVPEIQKQYLKAWIKRGDKVIVELGYDGKYNHEFEGYVTEVGSDFPIVILCADEMYKLKQGSINVSMQNATLRELLSRYITGYSIEAAEIELGTVLLEKTTPALLLEWLKDEYDVHSYFYNGTLYSGITYPEPPRGEVNYQLETNVRPDSNNLVYQLAESILLQINATSKLPDGETIDVKVGDEGGGYLRRTFYGIKSEEALKVLARRELDRIKKDGYKGSIQTYGIPFVDHGYVVNLSSYLYPDRDGSFYVKSVITTFSIDGYRRKIELDKEAP